MTTPATMSTSTQARLLAAIAGVRKATVDPEKLRALLRQLYRRRFMQEGRAAIAAAIGAIKGMSGPVDAEEAAVVMQTLETRLGVDNLGTTLVGRAETVVRDVFEIAARDVKSGYKLTVTDHRAINTIARHDLTWIKDHTEADLMPKFKRATTEVMQEGYSRDKLARRLADDLGGIVDADAEYWSDLADHTVSKARAIGRVQGFVDAGILYARIQAVLDKNTSQICRDLNGRVIEVAHLKRQADNLLAAKTKDELKAAATWQKRYTGKTEDLPPNLGLNPFHYRCRTEVFAIFEETKAEIDVGPRVSDDDADQLQQLTPQEHAIRVSDLQKRAGKEGLHWPSRAFDSHVAKLLLKHAATNEFNEGAEAYWRRTQDTVKNADRVFVQIHRANRADAVPRTQYVFVNTKARAATYVDDNGRVRTCRPIGGPGHEPDELLANFAKRDGRNMAWLKNSARN